MLTTDQYAAVATSLGCETAALRAVCEVESGGNGFLKDGRPKILFEGHIFWKQLLILNINPATIPGDNSDILYPVWDPVKVRPYYNMDQYARLDKAKKINEAAALKSASWGAFQIMGFNAGACGYATVQNFVTAQANELSQLQCFANFLKSTHLAVNLAHLDWAGFAQAYNGKQYRRNNYDTKLASAYAKDKQLTPIV